MTYSAPIKDMTFLLNHVINTKTGDHQLDADLVETILDEAGKLARDVIAPLNKTGDEKGCSLQDGEVTTALGFKEAYAQYRDNGWNSVPFPEEIGGQGLPWALAYAVQEMWQSANMSFGLCPMLNQSAVEALEIHGSKEQKSLYLEKMVTGEWTGTMNLTEPQSGSDLSDLKTMAVRQDDGSYKITGQKIYITYGEHDFAENIIHMVLARTPEAPEGVKGISLFLVPKFIPDDDGNIGTRNDLKCTGIEHKLGIHASPTCTMQFGDQGGANGWLVGEECEGLKLMFTMMNNARLAVGLQGVAIGERAFQHALAYARDRVQGKSVTGETGEKVAIIEHPDIRRMLLDMKATTEAGRALAYEAAAALDKANEGDNQAAAYMDLLTPIVKAWCTDEAVRITSEGIQVHGGMGFVEETGAAQYYRDARILPIYEGTNGIQANDLVFRKIIRDEGKTMGDYLNNATRLVDELEDRELKDLHTPFNTAVEKLTLATDHVLAFGKEKKHGHAAAVAKPYLHLFGATAAGGMMARAHMAALELKDTGADDPYYADKILTTRYFLTKILPRAMAAFDEIMAPNNDILNWRGS